MAVIFDCSSSMAMFRKPYTTTSSVSFAFPPPTAIAGLISAVIGLDNGSSRGASNANYWRELKGTQVAVAIKQRTKWFRSAINFWNLKDPGKSPHIQVKHQFVAFPKYRIYVKGGIEKQLHERLERGSFVYTPFLGVAYAIANLHYVGPCEESLSLDGHVPIDTIIPFVEGVTVDIAKSGRIFKEIVPFKLSEERFLLNSINVLYSDDERKIVLKERGALDVSRCMDDIVAWMPEW